MNNKKIAIKRLLQPLMQSEQKIYVASCCNKFFAGIRPPKSCGTCNKPAQVIEVTKDTNLDTIEV